MMPHAGCTLDELWAFWSGALAWVAIGTVVGFVISTAIYELQKPRSGPPPSEGSPWR